MGMVHGNRFSNKWNNWNILHSPQNQIHNRHHTKWNSYPPNSRMQHSTNRQHMGFPNGIDNSLTPDEETRGGSNGNGPNSAARDKPPKITALDRQKSPYKRSSEQQCRECK